MLPIEELKNLRNLTTLDDILRLSKFVFSLISHSGNLAHNEEPDLMKLYRLYKERKLSAWCYGSATFLSNLINSYDNKKIKAWVYNYGLSDQQLTHTVSLVQIETNTYLVDSYFCRHFVDENAQPLTFDGLMSLISRRQFEKIMTIYGDCTKPVMQHGVFEEWSPQKFENSVFKSWRELQDFDKHMNERFGSTNPFLLMQIKR